MTALISHHDHRTTVQILEGFRLVTFVSLGVLHRTTVQILEGFRQLHCNFMQYFLIEPLSRY